MDTNIYREYLIRKDNKITIPQAVIDIVGLKKKDWVILKVKDGEEPLLEYVRILQDSKGYFSVTVPKKIRNKYMNNGRVINALLEKVET